MYILDVIPLTVIPRGMPQILSYFHSDRLSRGAVVSILLNRRKITGVVLNAEPLKSRKLDFKKHADFELKNISSLVSEKPLVSELQLRMAAYLSSEYYAPLGMSLKAVLPSFWRKKKYPFPFQNGKILEERDFSETFVAPDIGDPGSEYLSAIRKQLDEGKQAFLLVPEKTAGEYFLGKFAGLDPLWISGETSGAEEHQIWQRVAAGEARFVIGTRIALFLPFQNLGLVILEDESNEAYQSDRAPRYHGADVARYLASVHGARLLTSALTPRVETYARLRPELPKLASKTEVVSQVSEIRAGNFSPLSRDLKEMLEDARHEKLLLYVPRKGHSPYILCEHCSAPLTCPQCSASLVLYKEPEERLVCHHCEHVRERPRACPLCGSYKLKAFGLGIEKVADEVRRYFKNRNLEAPPLFTLTGDLDQKEERALMESFFRSSSGVLLATQAVFGYRHLLRFRYGGILSSDTLIHIPDFRAEESLLRNIRAVAGMCRETVIQTYNPEDPALQAVGSGNPTSFYEKELEQRKLLAYPPFSRLVKLVFGHPNPKRAEYAARILKEKLAYALGKKFSDLRAEILGPTPAFISKEKGRYLWQILLKVKDEETKRRNQLLELVPSEWKVLIDPTTAI